jgi:hypothetical protein
MVLRAAKPGEPERFGLGIDVQLKGTKRVRKMFDDARDEILLPLKSGQFEQAVLDEIKERLTKPGKQRDPETGKAWPGLDKTTVKRRRSNKLGNRVKLFDTGSMHDALTVQKKGLQKLGRTGGGTGESEIGFKKNAMSKSSPGFLIEDIKLGKSLEKEYKVSIERGLIEYV